MLLVSGEGLLHACISSNIYNFDMNDLCIYVHNGGGQRSRKTFLRFFFALKVFYVKTKAKMLKISAGLH